jgi:hypothetical protein
MNEQERVTSTHVFVREKERGEGDDGTNTRVRASFVSLFSLSLSSMCVFVCDGALGKNVLLQKTMKRLNSGE